MKLAFCTLVMFIYHSLHKKTTLKKKEIVWLAGALIFILLVNFSVLGIDSLDANAILDINIHDTYFVIPKYNFFIFFAVVLLVALYLISVVIEEFTNITTNIILMIALTLLIIIATYAFSGVNILHNSTRKITEVASNSDKSMSQFYAILSYILIAVQLVLIALLAFTGIKTGKNYQKS